MSEHTYYRIRMGMDMIKLMDTCNQFDFARINKMEYSFKPFGGTLKIQITGWDTPTVEVVFHGVSQYHLHIETILGLDFKFRRFKRSIRFWHAYSYGNQPDSISSITARKIEWRCVETQEG